MTEASVRIGREQNFLLITEQEITGPHPYDFGTYVVEVVNGEFSGKARCYLNRNDFITLRDALSAMHRELKGSYSFEPIEGQLVFQVTIDKFGHLHLEGELFETAGDWSNSIKFTIGLDQTHLPDMIRSLDSLLA
ncbi:MAG: hypothetical protein R3B98_08985 [Hyphomonas sp.]